MGPDERSQGKFELTPEAFGQLAEKLDLHIERASSKGVNTSISIQNGFHFDSKKGEHQEIDLGEQQETFAASHAKLAVVAFKLVQGTIDKDTHRDLLSMLRISDNGAFKRQKRDIAHEVVDFAKTELELSTDILTIRDNNTSYAGQTTARDSLRMFLKTLQLAHRESKLSGEKAKLSDDINEALSTNTTKYGVKARLEPYTGLYLLNKTGDYSDDDEEIQEVVHHDVGVLLYRVGKEKLRLGYSITSSASSRLGAFKADRLNQEAGATLIEAIGGTPKSSLKASIGSAASKLFSK